MIVTHLPTLVPRNGSFGRRLESPLPITGTPFRMCDRHDQHLVRVDAVDNAKWKCLDRAFTMHAVWTGKNTGIRNKTYQCRINRTGKSHRGFDTSFGVRVERFVEVGARTNKELNGFHPTSSRPPGATPRL